MRSFGPAPSEASINLAECVLLACELNDPQKCQFSKDKELKLRLAAHLDNTEGASEFNRAMFSGIAIKNFLLENSIHMKLLPILKSSGAELASLFTGIIYGITGNESSACRSLPAGLYISERDKLGNDVSANVAVASVRAYNYLASSVDSFLISGIADLKDRDQVIKSISQLIAANISSDRNLFDATTFAAVAVMAHFNNRAIVMPSDKNTTCLTGIIFSAFGSSVEDLKPLSGIPESLSVVPDCVPEFSTLTIPAVARDEIIEEPEKLHHKQNVHALTSDQCRLFEKTLTETVEQARDLDKELPDDILAGLSPETLSRLGRDILEVREDTDTSVAELDLGNSNSDVQIIDVIQAVAFRFSQTSSTGNLSKEYLELASKVAELAKDGIIENIDYSYSHSFLNEFSEVTLLELCEDLMCSINDPIASLEDWEPITSANLNKTLNLVTGLEAFAFRLLSIAESEL